MAGVHDPDGHSLNDLLDDQEGRVLTYLEHPDTVGPPAAMNQFATVIEAKPDALEQELAQLRAGYAIRGAPESADMHIAPALTGALTRGQTDLADEFMDIWGIDLDLWRAMERNDSSASIAGRWSRSPARALVQDLDALQAMATDETVPGRDAIARAVGVDDLPHEPDALVDWLAHTPPRWRDLHTSVPGVLMQAWQPRDGRVATALRRLDSGVPHSVRGAALAWLLRRAATAPPYEIGGVTGDLRQDLSLRISAAFNNSAPSDGSFSAELETVLLHHAAHIADPDGSRGRDPDTTLRAWSISRWLHRCIRRSPHHSDDEEIMSVRLTARLLRPRPTGDALTGLDPLHPWRIGKTGIDLEELTVVAATVAHYHGPGPHLDPVPSSLVQALRRIARRPLRPGERDAEAAAHTFHENGHDATPMLATPGNALGWPAIHVAPPWVARRFLTERRMSWLVGTHDVVQQECLATLKSHPLRYSWLAFAFNTEAEHLPDTSAQLVAEHWRDQADGHLPPEASAALAIAGLAYLSDGDRARALTLARTAAASWRPHLLDAHASAAARLSLHGHSRAAISTLLDVASSNEDLVPVHDRVNSAFLAARHLARASDDGDLKSRLVALIRTHPFRDHPSLQREIRRVGIDQLSSRP